MFCLSDRHSTICRRLLRCALHLTGSTLTYVGLEVSGTVCKLSLNWSLTEGVEKLYFPMCELFEFSDISWVNSRKSVKSKVFPLFN
jgi:hypothetical protein